MPHKQFRYPESSVDGKFITNWVKLVLDIARLALGDDPRAFKAAVTRLGRLNAKAAAHYDLATGGWHDEAGENAAALALLMFDAGSKERDFWADLISRDTWNDDNVRTLPADTASLNQKLDDYFVRDEGARRPRPVDF